jgi:hypothetical protein
MCIFQTTLKTHQTEFEFFIQKLYRKTLYIFSRKDRFLHQEPNKLDLHFSDFSTIFNDFSKLLQETLNTFTEGPSETFTNSHMYPYFTKISLERSKSSQCAPVGAREAAGRRCGADPGRVGGRRPRGGLPAPLGCTSRPADAPASALGGAQGRRSPRRDAPATVALRRGFGAGRRCSRT